jgi:Arc/MetJ family transcription regulator
MSIELDDELLAKAIKRYHLATPSAAVDLALRRLVGEPMSREGEAMSKEEVLAMQGTGWSGDLDEMRHDRIEDR